MLNLPPGTLNIAEILESSNIYGPGKRFVIWVQGCGIRCQGCWNKDMLPFEVKKVWNIDDLYERIISIPEIEGITILGGEPLHQSKSLFELAKKLKKHNLTLMLYTGFDISEITDSASLNLLSLSDVIIAGPFVEKLRSTTLKWRGSTNQEILFSSNVYQSGFPSIQEETEVEFHINNHGKITLVGYPDRELIEEVFE